MWYILFKVAAVLAAWCMWWLVFGLECYINGLNCAPSWALPFKGLAQDIEWLLHPSRRPEGCPVLNILHSLLIVPPVLAFVF